MRLAHFPDRRYWFFRLLLVESFCFVNNLLGLGAVATILTRNPEAFAQSASGIGPSCDAPRWRCTQLCVPRGEYQCVTHAASEASAKQAHEERS